MRLDGWVEGLEVSHLQFVDDTIIFFPGGGEKFLACAFIV